MPIRISEIFEIEVLQELFDSFSQATGTVAAILDLDGNVLIASGWQDICTRFHRATPGTACRCHESDTALASQLEDGQKYNVYQCKNGLVDVAVPIIVADSHIGNLFTGQFFFSPPDETFFRKQANQFQFDKKAYLEALSRVPVFSQEQVERTMAFLCRLAEAIGEMGVAKLRRDAELTERLRTEKALLESERQKRLIIETVPDLIWLKDTDGKFLACNRMFEHFYGVKEDDIIGKTDYDFVDRELADSFREHDKATVAADRPLRNERWLTFPDDGRRILFETTRTPLKDDNGTVLGSLGISRDITERRQTEDALRHAQKMEAVGQLTGGLAHDLNNMLSVISMNIELLNMKTGGDPDLTKYIDSATQGVKRATGLTRKMLDFSRTEVNETRRVSVNAFIQGMENLIAKTLTPSITLKTDLFEKVWPVDIDPSDLEHAILNMAINARDAMPKGGALMIETANKEIDEPYVRRNPGSTAGDYVMIAVSDEGTGMAPEIAEKAFDPFFTTKEVGKGTGLGLSMVYGFVQRSGGHAKIYSEPGLGTTIRLYLPRARMLPEGSELPPVRHAELPTGDETILVVDDEENLLSSAAEALGSLGYRTVTANNGKQAMDILRRDPDIELLFSDVVMPGGMDGFRLAVWATENRPGLKILLTSGFPRKRGDFVNGQDRHTGHFVRTLLHKPYNVAELAGAVRDVLDKRD